MIYQIHEDHGKHIAYSPQEAKFNEENGWKRVTKEVWLKHGYEKSDDTLAEQYEAKFGKKPHHAMKTETIEQQLHANSE